MAPTEDGCTLYGTVERGVCTTGGITSVRGRNRGERERASRRRIKSFKERMGDNFTVECNKIEKVIRLLRDNDIRVQQVFWSSGKKVSLSLDRTSRVRISTWGLSKVQSQGRQITL